MNPYPWHFWLIGIGLTLALEAPIALWLLRAGERRIRRRVALFVFANIATHPLVWFFFPSLPMERTDWITLAELWAFGAEAFIYSTFATRLSTARGVLTSLLANGFSFGMGLVIMHYWARWLFRY